MLEPAGKATEFSSMVVICATIQLSVKKHIHAGLVRHPMINW
ncbi:MAG: hypothetical protein OES28_02210 [Desulfobulbaceae bacterium]|jgi:hypothetical protein|nr:hypothetical protein [Desulfobulbaceae bacterium]